jgi:phytoene dehydrogenase-like protein
LPDAIVVGAGPNGLVAANMLVDQGWQVLLIEAQDEPGGAVKSAEVAEAGFTTDLFSGFYPLAAVSPHIRALGLEDWGLEWASSPVVVSHQHIDGRTAAIHEDLDATCESLERFAPGDGERWRTLYGEWSRVEQAMVDALFEPFPPVLPALRLAGALGKDLLRFARLGVVPVRRFAEERFEGEGGGWLMAGNALHADLTPDMAGSTLFGLVMSGLGQSFGFPFPRGGAGKLTDALVARFEAGGGRLLCGQRVDTIEVASGRATGVRLEDGRSVFARRAVLADVSAISLYEKMLPPGLIPERLREDMEHFQLDNGTFKVNWALKGPVPWIGEESRRAATVHLAGGIDELSGTTAELVSRLIPSKPFLIFGQYSMADQTRAPEGCESAWAYTHVPQDPAGDAGGRLTGAWNESEARVFADRMEARIEQAAPGFRELIRSRQIQTPLDLEAADSNLVGGALNGGTAQIHQQLVFRPTPGMAGPSTPVSRLYLASASAHPGGGVHGGPGANAAKAALNGYRRRRALGIGGAALVGSAAGALATRLIRS